MIADFEPFTEQPAGVVAVTWYMTVAGLLPVFVMISLINPAFVPDRLFVKPTAVPVSNEADQ